MTATGGTLRSRILFLARDTGYYGLLGAVSRFAGLITLPVLTRVLSPGGYGIVDGVVMLSNVFAPLLVMGIDSALGVLFFDSEDVEHRRRAVSTGLLLQVAVAVVLAVALFFAGDLLLERFLGLDGAGSAYLIAVAALPGTIIIRYAVNVAKYTFRRVRFAVLSLGYVFSTALLTVYLVAVAGLGVDGVFWAMLAGSSAFGLVGIYYCREFLRPIFDRSMARDLLQIGIPYMVVGVAAAALPLVDRYFILRFMTVEDLGVYAVAARVASLLGLVVGAFQIAWSPFALAVHRQEGAGRTFSLALVGFTYVATLGVLGLTALGPQLIGVLAAERFMAGTALVAPLSFAILLGGVFWFPLMGVTIAKKTVWNPVSFAVGMACAAGVALALIPRLGLLGAALATVVGQAAACVVMAYGSHREYPVRFEYRRAVLVLLLGGAFAAAIEAVDGPGALGALVLRLLLTAVFALVALRVSLGAGDRQRARDLLAQGLQRLRGPAPA